MSKNKDIAKEERRLTDFAAALDAETVKITVIDSNGNKTEKEVDAEKINEQAEELSKMRENGCYISLEPKSSDRQYVVVSGLTELALGRVVHFKKCLILPFLRLNRNSWRVSVFLHLRQCKLCQP